jgi:hypothetical protein
MARSVGEAALRTGSTSETEFGAEQEQQQQRRLNVVCLVEPFPLRTPTREVQTVHKVKQTDHAEQT